MTIKELIESHVFESTSEMIPKGPSPVFSAATS